LTKPLPAPAPPQEPPKASRITLANAIKVFLNNGEGSEIAPPTLRKYRTVAKQLTEFADHRGYIILDQFTSGDTDIF
jgi:hypothetical protein